MPELLKCQFCLSQSIEAKAGATTCPECNTQFEIGDSPISVFGGTVKFNMQKNIIKTGHLTRLLSTRKRRCGVSPPK
jgi:hypothetical protein